MVVLFYSVNFISHEYFVLQLHLLEKGVVSEKSNSLSSNIFHNPNLKNEFHEKFDFDGEVSSFDNRIIGVFNSHVLIKIVRSHS